MSIRNGASEAPSSVQAETKVPASPGLSRRGVMGVAVGAGAAALLPLPAVAREAEDIAVDVGNFTINLAPPFDTVVVRAVMWNLPGGLSTAITVFDEAGNQHTQWFPALVVPSTHESAPATSPNTDAQAIQPTNSIPSSSDSMDANVPHPGN